MQGFTLWLCGRSAVIHLPVKIAADESSRLFDSLRLPFLEYLCAHGRIASERERNIGDKRKKGEEG